MLASVYHFACPSGSHRMIRSTREVTDEIPACSICKRSMTAIRTEERHALSRIAEMLHADTPTGAEAFARVWIAFTDALSAPDNRDRRAAIAERILSKRRSEIGTHLVAVLEQDKINNAIRRVADAVDGMCGAFRDCANAVEALRKEIADHDPILLATLGKVADESIVRGAETVIAAAVDAGLDLIGISEPAPAASTLDPCGNRDRDPCHDPPCRSG